MFEKNIVIDLKSNKEEIIKCVNKNTDRLNKTFINRDYTKIFKGKTFESSFQIERIKKGKTAYTPVLFGTLTENNSNILLELNFKIKSLTIAGMFLGLIIYIIVFTTLIYNITETNKRDIVLFTLLVLALFVISFFFILLSLRNEKRKSLESIIDLFKDFSPTIRD